MKFLNSSLMEFQVFLSEAFAKGVKSFKEAGILSEKEVKVVSFMISSLCSPAYTLSIVPISVSPAALSNTVTFPKPMHPSTRYVSVGVAYSS